jgi:hypothetical protein
MKNFKKLKIRENGMEVVEIVYRTSGQFLWKKNLV